MTDSEDIIWRRVGRTFAFHNPPSGATFTPTGEFRLAKKGEWAVHAQGGANPFQATFDHVDDVLRQPYPTIILALSGTPKPKLISESLRGELEPTSKNIRIVGQVEKLEALALAVQAKRHDIEMTDDFNANDILAALAALEAKP
jgi:hypothetical protein